MDDHGLVDEIGDYRVRLEHDLDPVAPSDWGNEDRDSDEWRWFIEGEVYTQVIEKRVRWTNEDDEERDTWEHFSSCGGFIGQEWAQSQALDALKSIVG